MKKRTWLHLVSCIVVLAGGGAGAQTAPAEAKEAQTLEEALLQGKINFNLRLRVEVVEQEGVDGAQAWLERLRLGYETKPLEGFTAYAEMEDIHAADDDRYNAAGTNSNPGKAVVADPEDTELNQFYLKYTYDWITAILGRQRITLDDHRFVGNVGWRMNEQTFDAITVKATPMENLALFYSYVRDVNRIFGPAADADFQSNSHLINVAYSGIPIVGKVVVFAYLLDFDNSAANSSDTVGFRLDGSNDLTDDLSLRHWLSYAKQSDAGDNTTDYDADYYLVDLALTKKGLGHIGGAYEVLGSDKTSGGFASFRTPLATLHKFNGWADVFLTTPATGLKDLYFYAGTTLWGCNARIIKHFFESDEGSDDLGEETDFVMSKKLDDHTTVLGKFAWFDGNDPYADRSKVWFQLEYGF